MCVCVCVTVSATGSCRLSLDHWIKGSKRTGSRSNFSIVFRLFVDLFVCLFLSPLFISFWHTTDTRREIDSRRRTQSNNSNLEQTNKPTVLLLYSDFFLLLLYSRSDLEWAAPGRRAVRRRRHGAIRFQCPHLELHSCSIKKEKKNNQNHDSSIAIHQLHLK